MASGGALWKAVGAAPGGAGTDVALPAAEAIAVIDDSGVPWDGSPKAEASCRALAVTGSPATGCIGGAAATPRPAGESRAAKGAPAPLPVPGTAETDGTAWPVTAGAPVGAEKGKAIFKRRVPERV
ncbi:MULTISPECIES: hypothetical protein [Pacificimonas]|uniref:Uncharacterized protein n=1 Tax=Pacificimonas aurantium TaxID=1250540 RepID=A0ABS7WLF5_9SPHN|nr:MULTISPECIES: hypothetical protein [Pacificimonas]MBZ6379215.1 hypothetical protein [Pacificimonas aurantium]